MCQIVQTYDFSTLEQEIKSTISSQNIPSVVVAVSKDDKIIYKQAFGYSDVENKVKAKTSTSYQLASVSKPFTATGIMLLHKKKEIHIDSSVIHYIHPLKLKKSNHNYPKVIDILNHTSGLGTYFELTYSDEPFYGEDFISAFNRYGSLFQPPGTICEYSNLGYGLLDYIIEKQSGESFSDFMNKELFTPLNLKHTFIDKPYKKNIEIAKKYGFKLNLLPEINNNTRGAGNFYSSIEDLISFGMYNLKPQNKTILNSKDINFMHSYINKNTLYHYYNSTYYGLGWYFKRNDNGYKIVWHEGGMMGVSSMLKLIPEENIAIAVIINTSNQEFCRDITSKLGNIILPNYNAEAINEIADYKSYTTDKSYLGKWEGIIKVEDLDIPCKLELNTNGKATMEYLDMTYKSYFTKNNPIPHKTELLMGIVNDNSFIGMLPGNLPSARIQKEFSQFLSLKLYKNKDTLSGTIVALAAAEREYYAYPFAIKLKKQ